MGKGTNRAAPIAKRLPPFIFLGPSAGAGPAKSISQKSAVGPNPHWAPRVSRADHRRRFAGPFPGAIAQNHLAAGAEGSVGIYDLRFTRRSSRREEALINSRRSRPA